MVVQLPQAPEVGILEGEPRADVTATGAGALQCLLPGFVGNSFLGLASEPTGTENTTSTTFYVGVLRVYMLHWLGAGVTRFSQRKYLALENDEEELVQRM